MKIFLISGKAFNGKDSAAIFLKENLDAMGYKTLTMHYADYLKFICKEYFGWNGQKDEIGRQLLQYVGTDVGRKKDPDIWVKPVMNFLTVFGNEFDYIFIPDTRFPNEITKLQEAGLNPISLRVKRLNYISTLTTAQQLHPSEVSLDDWKFDYYLQADNLEGLKIEVDRAMAYLM